MDGKIYFQVGKRQGKRFVWYGEFPNFDDARLYVRENSVNRYTAIAELVEGEQHLGAKHVWHLRHDEWRLS